MKAYRTFVENLTYVPKQLKSVVVIVVVAATFLKVVAGVYDLMPEIPGHQT